MRIGKIVFNLVVCGLFMVGCNSSVDETEDSDSEIEPF
jgi:hypothetical protein